MRTLSVYLALAITLPIACIAQQSKNTPDSSQANEHRIVYAIASSLESCQQDNQVLQKQRDDCAQYLQISRQDVADADNALAALNHLMAIKDSIASLQGDKIKNLNTLVKVDNKLANHRLIGFTLGGFAFGVAIPTLIYLIKH